MKYVRCNTCGELIETKRHVGASFEYHPHYILREPHTGCVNGGQDGNTGEWYIRDIYVTVQPLFSALVEAVEDER